MTDFEATATSLPHLEPREPGPVQLGPRYRAEVLAGLSGKRYDLLIVGGGINGAGIAYDAAMRGFSVLLVEKSDFASGTSSRSSKLIHGGIRYLKNLELSLVFEALRERHVLLKQCPHIVRPLPFLYPVYEGDPDGKLAITAGMWLYDILSLFRAPARHQDIGPEQIATVEPGLEREGLRACPRYYDAWMDDARLVLTTVQSAAKSGADVLNHMEVRSLMKQGDRIHGALLTDRLTGRDVAVEARLVVNAAGPWLDRIAAMERPDSAPRLKPTKGVHLLVPRERLPIGNAVVLRSPDDGRMLFAIPWERMSLIGTTDTFFDGEPDAVYADRQDVGYLLRAANKSFPGALLETKDVRSTYAGLRPLMSQDGRSASDISREHEVWVSPGGLLSIGGGKFTTFRAIAQEVVDHAAEILAEQHGVVRMKRAYTDRVPFEGGDLNDLDQATAEVERRAGPLSDPMIARNLVRNFGSNARHLVDEARRRGHSLEPVLPGLPYSVGELAWSAAFEAPGRLADLFMRRTRLHLEGGESVLKVAEPVALAVAPLLDWDTERVDQELRLYEDELRRTRACLDA